MSPPPAQRQFGSAVLPRHHKVSSNSRAIPPATPRELRSMHRSEAAQSPALRHAENFVPAAAMLTSPAPPHSGPLSRPSPLGVARLQARRFLLPFPHLGRPQ